MWRLIGNAMVLAGVLLVLAFGLHLADLLPDAVQSGAVQCPDGLTAVRLEPPHPCPPPA